MCDKNYDKYVDELNKKINKNFNLDDIKQFLDYDNNFWNYIKILIWIILSIFMEY